MRRSVVFLIACFLVFNLFAQEEFNATVTVNADQIQSSNKQIYKTLEKSLTEFINQTKWTNKKFLSQERIHCAFTFIINSQEGNRFSGSLQVQAMRPVYGSIYETPILNVNDTNLSFKYTEFQPLLFNPNSFDGNLVSTVVFYLYTILGLDADTFALNSGDSYFEKAQNVMRQAQQSGGEAWQDKIGEQNRFSLIDGITSSKFSGLRKINYEYHRYGLDVFESNQEDAKRQIAKSILLLSSMYNVTVGNYMIRVFLDAKANEIVDVFSNGKTIGKEMSVQETLQQIAPTQGDLWSKIKL